MASVATQGGLTFEDNEVNLVSLSKQVQYSPRGKKLSTVVTASCFGEIQAATVAEIITRINTIDQGLANNTGDFRYTVGGALAHSILNTSDCSSGVRVVARSFPKGDAAELATKRSFSFMVQATYDNAQEDLVSWTDTIQITGTGGPKFFILETTNQPFAIYVTNASIQFIHRSGMAVGYVSYIAPPGPLSGGLELQDRRVITNISGRNVGNAIRYQTTKWSYLHARDPTTFGTITFTPESR